jgi:photoactive yellow protein
MSRAEQSGNCLWCGTQPPSSDDTLCVSCRQVAIGDVSLSGAQLDELPFGALELDERGTVLAFNREEENFSGYSRGDVIGRNFFTDVAPCADVQDFHGRFDEFLRGEMNLFERFYFTYHFPDKDVRVLITFLRVARDQAVAIARRSA